ncbi:MAG: hypothetical protein P9X26_03490 [Candidatus Stygibacter frigidus]|nr:hypothetical protein [Candidatus Stygibacter frigidus]
MKYYILIIIVLAVWFMQADDITVYQSNGQGFALVHAVQHTQLTKGENEIELQNLAEQIRVNSLLLNDNQQGVEIIRQNFSPNYSRAGNIIEDAIDRIISVTNSDGESIRGILRFYDGQYLGISDTAADEFHLVKEQKIADFHFQTFFDDVNNFSPSVSWLLNSSKKQDIELNYSYLTGSIGWDAIYQTIWDGDKKLLTLNSQVELTNNCGKDFLGSKVKLVAGDVKNLDQETNMRAAKTYALHEDTAAMGMPVSRSSLSSFHLYTLSTPIDCPDNSSRQFQLYPSTIIKAKEYYLFNSNGYETKLQKTIAFKNSKENGAGNPLPQGTVKMYTPDKTDGQLQFIGESVIENSPTDKTVILKLGDAFDLSGETKTMNVQYSDNRRKVISSDYQIVLNNNSEEDVDIIVKHQLDRQLPEIIGADFDYERTDAFTMEIKLKVAAGSEKTLSWSQTR